MPAANLQALVVDDEPLVRQLTARALCTEGFSCDIAGDGAEALRKIEGARYDVVVTDLCMPHQHGHALASSLVERKERPLVIVLTALCDPRMTKDLLTRGVDDVMYKPVEYPAFAAKIRGLVNRRTCEGGSREDAAPSPAKTGALPPRSPDKWTPTPINPGEFQRSLDQVPRLVPISPATLQILKLTQAGVCKTEQLAAVARQEGALVVEILRLANSAFFNPAGGKIIELEPAIARIGQRRVCELALSIHASGLFNCTGLSWLNRQAMWRRCRAAGLAIDLLVAQGQHATQHGGLFLSAIMHGLGRVTLGLLFPQHYEAMIAACRSSGQPLAACESQLFPLKQAAVMAQLLDGWGVPADVYQPLRYLDEEFATVARLSNFLRTKVELVKLAVLLGQIAAGVWDPWDAVDFPRESLLRRLRIGHPEEILQTIRTGLQDEASAATATASSAPRSPGELRYCALTLGRFDFLAELLAATGMNVRCVAEDPSAATQPTLVNCLGFPPQTVLGRLRLEQRSSLTLVTEASSASSYANLVPCLGLPASFAALQDACQSAQRG